MHRATCFRGIENLLGSDHADTLVGDVGDNVLRGADGARCALGQFRRRHARGRRGGDALLDGQDGVDWASYAASETGVTVRLWAGDGTGGDATGDTLRGIENLRGSAHADTLVGDGGDNRFLGGRGMTTSGPTMATTRWRAARATTSCAGRVGRTRQLRGIARGRHAAALGRGRMGRRCHGRLLLDIENAEGSAHDDVLSGSGGDNMLSGLAGRDEIWAGRGDDTLLGGDGDDVLRGQGETTS
jgi:Ca2+-binding RTX toxin-like protein